MSDSLDDLIQRLLEGEASVEERTRLEARMASDPTVRARHDELARVFHALASIEPAPVPADLREDILHAIRGAAPSRASVSTRAGRPLFSWMRLTLPLTAVAVAVIVLIANQQGLPGRSPADQMSGSMSGAASPGSLRLGAGAQAVWIRSDRTDSGFQLRIQNAGAPSQIRLEALTAGAQLRLEAQAARSSSPVEASLPANALVIAEGTAPDSGATIRVSITFPDGQSATGEIRLRGREVVR